MAADIILHSIIVIVVAREPSIDDSSTRSMFKIRHFSTNLSRIEFPIKQCNI